MKKIITIWVFLLFAAATLDASAGCIMTSGRYCTDESPKACSSNESCVKKDNGTECHCVKRDSLPEEDANTKKS